VDVDAVIFDALNLILKKRSIRALERMGFIRVDGEKCKVERKGEDGLLAKAAASLLCRSIACAVARNLASSTLPLAAQPKVQPPEIPPAIPDETATEACPRTDEPGVAPRKLDEAFFEKYIEGVAEELRLPEDVTRNAVETFREAKSARRYFGRGNVALACLALSVKATCLPVSLTKLLRAAEAVLERVENAPRFHISRKAVAAAYRKLASVCGVKASACQLTPTIYLERLLKKFEATADERKKAAELNRKILEAKLHVGKRPPSIAAATAYIAFAGCVALRQLAEAAGVTDVTVRNNVKRILAELKIPLSEAFPRRTAFSRRVILRGDEP